MSKNYQQKVIYKTEPVFIKLQDVRPGKHGFNVYLKVLECKHESLTRQDGSCLTICTGLVGDETGNIEMKVVGKYAPVLQKGNVVAFRNARSEVYQEHHRLELDAFGKISREDINIYDIGDKQMSAIVYETRYVRK